MRHLLHLALLCCLASCGKAPGTAPATAAAAPALPTLTLATVQPKQAAIQRWVALPASAAPWQQVTLQAKAEGYLSRILFDKGDRVKAGTTLAEIDVPELQADLLRYQAELELAEQDFQRINKAMAQAADLVMKQTVDAARAKRDIAKAHLASVQAQLSYARIVAPFDALVTERFVDPGAFISSGTQLLTLVDDSRLRIQFGVPEVDSALVKKDQPVQLTTEALPGKVKDSVVARITGAMDPATRTLLVEADLGNADSLLHPGQYFTARIALEKHEQALVIPVTALLMEKAKASVFKLTDGKAKKTAIKVGFNDGLHAEVLEGTTAADTLVSFDKTTVNDGQPIAPTGSAGILPVQTTKP